MTDLCRRQRARSDRWRALVARVGLEGLRMRDMRAAGRYLPLVLCHCLNTRASPTIRPLWWAHLAFPARSVDFRQSHDMRADGCCSVILSTTALPRGMISLLQYAAPWREQHHMNPNKALWEKGDFTKIAASMRESGEAVVAGLGITSGSARSRCRRSATRRTAQPSPGFQTHPACSRRRSHSRLSS